MITHKSFDPPCDPVARKTLPRPPHSTPRFVTIMIRPSGGVGCESSRCDLGQAKTEIFLQRGLDTRINKLPVGQITRLSRSTGPADRVARATLRRSPRRFAIQPASRSRRWLLVPRRNSGTRETESAFRMDLARDRIKTLGRRRSA